LTAELIEKKQRATYTNWYTNLKDKAKIRDFRYMFF